MFVYYHNHRFCEIGLETQLTDADGEELRTGDIVAIYKITAGNVLCDFFGLSVVLAEHYDSSEDAYKELLIENRSEPYIMGMRTLPLHEPEQPYPTAVWRIRKMKSFDEIVNNEQWDAWGFCYSDS